MKWEKKSTLSRTSSVPRENINYVEIFSDRTTSVRFEFIRLLIDCWLANTHAHTRLILHYLDVAVFLRCVCVLWPALNRCPLKCAANIGWKSQIPSEYTTQRSAQKNATTEKILFSQQLVEKRLLLLLLALELVLCQPIYGSTFAQNTIGKVLIFSRPNRFNQALVFRIYQSSAKLFFLAKPAQVGRRHIHNFTIYRATELITRKVNKNQISTTIGHR